MTFSNCYEDVTRAEAYSTLEFKNTYHLAYRDIPAILGEHVRGRKAVDFGCGAGRSTRFLRQLGFEVTGVDIAEDMIRKARELDPSGDYRLVPGDDLSALPAGTYDLVLAAFTFDNIAGRDKKVNILRDLGRLLKREGKLVLIVSRPEMYSHEWASFSSKRLIWGSNRNTSRWGGKTSPTVGSASSRLHLGRSTCSKASTEPAISAMSDNRYYVKLEKSTLDAPASASAGSKTTLTHVSLY